MITSLTATLTAESAAKLQAAMTAARSAPAQVPRALPRTGQGASPAGALATAGALAALAGFAVRRRPGRQDRLSSDALIRARRRRVGHDGAWRGTGRGR
jgi:LPXTG-motif cell wall-anchored protein